MDTLNFKEMPSFDKQSMNPHPESSGCLVSADAGKYCFAGVPSFLEHGDDASCLPLSHYYGVDHLCSEKKKQNGSCPGVSVKVEGYDSYEIYMAKSNHELPGKTIGSFKSHNFLAEVKAELIESSASFEYSANALCYCNAIETIGKTEYVNKHSVVDLDHVFLKERMKMLVAYNISSINCIDADVDHMSLKKRMKMLVANNVSFNNCTNNFKCSKYLSKHSSSFSPASEIILERKSCRSRKRKKSATDSAKTALEEDAPVLLQVLITEGINLDEIKLYGISEDDDMIDIPPIEDSFEELENVISKLFAEPSNSLLNIDSLRIPRGSKAAYCLSCLVSLIEQTQYLLLRKFPVQWGWCRDLQSFIFVFEKHNRIVLERPEYGYATYFFELVESLPINWQIKRLVIAMKATHNSRATIVENRPLLVGQDLSEGEARILMEYGWEPNSGLGSLLHFCDRVIHDKRNQMNNSEWKMKIGNMLMSGLDGGRLVSDNIPKKVADYLGDSCSVVKLESDYM